MARSPARVGRDGLKEGGQRPFARERGTEQTFGEARVLEQRGDHPGGRVAAQHGDHAGPAAPGDRDLLADREPRKPDEQRRLSRASNRGPNPHLDAHREQVRPVEPSDEIECDHFGCPWAERQGATHRIGRDEARPLGDHARAIALEERIAQGRDRLVRAEPLEVLREQTGQLLWSRFAQPPRELGLGSRGLFDRRIGRLGRHPLVGDGGDGIGAHPGELTAEDAGFCYRSRSPMAISRNTQTQLSKGDFSAIESDWLAKSESSPEDLDYFVGVARALIGNGEDDRAATLLEMLDDELKTKELWRVRLKLLSRAGSLFIAGEKLHAAIMATLKRLHGARPSFQGLAEAAGLTRATHDLPKTWEKVERFESLLAFDIGSVVMMEGKGVGRVVEVNLGLESFKVDFERIRGMNVGFKAAAKLLRPLEPDHILRRKLEAPDALKALAKERPSELLRGVLVSFGRPLNATEIREALAGVVTEAQWTGFWNAARKHPQVVAAGTGKQTYRWAETSADALDDVWRSFSRAEPRRKIELFRRDAGRDAALAGKMAEDLGRIAESVNDTEPGLAWEIWFNLERQVGAPEGVDWAPDALLQDAEPRRLAGGIEDRLLRERAYAMWREKSERWPEIFRDLFGIEQDPRALDLLADGLAVAAPKDYERILDGLLSQPHRQPAAFAWLAERAATDESLRARNPLRLMQQIFTAVTRDEFTSVRLRLLALVESGSTVPRLLSHLSETQAPQAFDAVERAAALEPYQRQQLANALELRFASLRKDDETPLYALRGSIEEKRQELQKLLTIEIPANRKAIEEARALGDLRENFEYKSARQRHEYLNARAASLNGDLTRVRPIEPPSDLSEVRIGTRANLAGGRTLTLLGPWESQPEQDVISYESDLGKSILGLKAGGDIELDGTKFRIESVESAV